MKKMICVKEATSWSTYKSHVTNFTPGDIIYQDDDMAFSDPTAPSNSYLGLIGDCYDCFVDYKEYMDRQYNKKLDSLLE